MKVRTIFYIALIIFIFINSLFFCQNLISKKYFIDDGKRIPKFYNGISLQDLYLNKSYTINSEQKNDFIFTSETWSIIGISSIQLYFLIDGYNTWWKDGKHKFHLYNPPCDWAWFGHPFERGIDKVSHFYGSYFFYHFQKNILVWGGHEEKNARLISAIYTAASAFIVEIGDAYSQYGASYEDLVFNIAGLGYGLLQDNVPFLQNFNFKFSYFPTEGYGLLPHLTENYAGQIFWLTLNMSNIFKNSVGKVLPEWIQPAIGYSISTDNRAEFIIGLDFSLSPLFNTSVPAAKFVERTLNLIHLPAPGVKFVDGRKPEYKLFLLN